MAVQGANTTKRGRASQLSYTIVDVDLMIAELVRTREELRDIDARGLARVIDARGAAGRERNRALAEPLGRVELVQRFADGILERHERARKPRAANHVTEEQLGASAAVTPQSQAPKKCVRPRKARR